MNDKLIIIGAGGHGKVIADIGRKNGYKEILFLDDYAEQKNIGCYKIVGKSNQFVDYDCDMFVAIGNAAVRQKILEKIKAEGKTIATLIHPNAVIGEDVIIGKGTAIMAGTVINSGSVIGEGCIINTCASVDHDNRIGNYVHVSVGAHLAGTVSVEENTWIGIGAVVSNNLSICKDCMIGAGAVVVKDIKQAGVYVGIPARKVNK